MDCGWRERRKRGCWLWLPTADIEGHCRGQWRRDHAEDSSAGKKNAIVKLGREHGATSIRVFGSVARGDNRETSDVDLLVEFEKDRTLFDLIDLRLDLRDLLVLLGHKRTFWCRIVLWDHASLRQAHKRSASRHI